VFERLLFCLGFIAARNFPQTENDNFKEIVISLEATNKIAYRPVLRFLFGQLKRLYLSGFENHFLRLGFA